MNQMAAAIKVKCLHKIITFERETFAMLRIKDYRQRLKFNEIPCKSEEIGVI
jgi:hypothetical protein